VRDFDKARELFADIIDTKFYFDSLSAEIGKNKIIEAIEAKNAPLIFVIADPGEGKSYIMNLTNEQLKEKQLTIYIDHPFFDKRDLLKMLYDAKGVAFDPSINFNSLKEKLIEEYKDTKHTIFLDEAQLLNEEQFELIRILSDTKVFQFVLSMHKEEGSKILEKKHFKSRTKVVVKLQSLKLEEVDRYIKSTLMLHGFGDITQLFKNREVKTIYRYTKGNFRTVKKFLYTLFDILSYAKQNSLEKYQTVNSCTLKMSALDAGLIDG